MSSPYREVSSINISSGVKAKLQKWIGKASTNVREKQAGKEISAEIMDYEPVKCVEVTSNLSPQHSRSRSAPIVMEKLVKKRRKRSEATAPTWYINEDSERENAGIDSSPKNGIIRGITHSVRLHESSSAPSLAKVEKQIVLGCSKETSLGDQTGSVGVNTTGGIDKDTNGMNGYARNNDISGSSTARKLKLSRERSKTSFDLTGESGSSDNEKISSAHSLDSIPQNVQQLSGQIQFRLQKWVERASHLATQRDRRPSEESASSTDDSVYAPDSPSSGLTLGPQNESQVQKIKELELALKELVENVGVRGGTWPSKDSNSNSPSSSSRKRSRQNSQRHGSDCQENGELNGSEKNGLIENHSRDVHESPLRQSRNHSSSSTGSDEAVNKTDGEKYVFDNHPKDDDLEDLDDVIFMKLSNTIREQTKNHSPHDRRSANLQDVLISETLIDETPRYGEGDNAKKIAQKNLEKKQREGSKENLSADTETRNRVGKTLSTDGQKETESSKPPSENKLGSKNGAGKKLERPRVKKQDIALDANSLKVGPNLAVRESMRQYLKFKDADLSAFAVECVRHANKKKQTLREGDQAQHDSQGSEERMVTQKKLENTNNTQVVDAAEQNKPIVVLSPHDKNQQIDEQKGLNDTQKLECAGSSELPMENESAKEIIASDGNSRNIFARTAEEAEWFEKKKDVNPMPKRKGSLGRASSHPPVEPANTSQRLYKFPSMPMFYIPQGKEDTESGKQKQISLALHESINAGTGSDPFYHGEIGSKTKPRASSSLTLKDINGNDAIEKPKSSSRPKLRQRKLSAPPRTALYPMPSTIRVDIEALI